MAVDHELPSDLQEAMDNLQRTMADCDKVLKRLTEVPLQDSKVKLEPIEKAKLDLTATYAINSLFWIYLVTQGVNAADHPIKDELERVKKYMGKIKDTEEKVKGASVKLNKPAAKRFIASALWTPKEKKQDSEEREVGKSQTEVEQSTPKSEKHKRKFDNSSSAKKHRKKKKKLKQD